MIRKLHDFALGVVANISPNMYCNYIFRKQKKGKFRDIEALKLKGEPLLLKYLLTKDSKVLDVGSHVGEYIFYSKGIVPLENVYAFEPNPSSFKRLKTVFKKSNTFNIALSNQNGSAEFKIPSVNKKLLPTRGTLLTDYVEKDEDSHINFTVKTQTVDSFVEEFSITNIGLIKVDVEGFEIEVIKGASKTIEIQKPTLILELEQRHLDEPLTDVIEKIKDLGYQCFYFDFDSMGLVKLEGKAESIQLEKYHMVNPVRYVNNFVFIPDDSDIIKNMDNINQDIRKG